MLEILQIRVKFRFFSDGPSTTRRPPQQPASPLPQPADALLQPGPLPQPADALPEPADPLPQPEGQLLPILPTAPERKASLLMLCTEYNSIYGEICLTVLGILDMHFLKCEIEQGICAMCN